MTVFMFAARVRTRLSSVQRENERLYASNAALHDKAAARASYHEQIERLARLEERGRVAQDVHDRVGHAITGSIIQLEAALAVIDEDSGSARSMIANAMSALREGIDSIRATLRGIKPAQEQLGVGGIQAMLDGFALNAGIAARLTHSGNLGAITRLQWNVITDNLRECLTNTIMHSTSRAIRLSVDVMNRLVKVEARDDGRGVYSLRKGLGIQGMEERTEGIGGKLIVDGSRGFSVIMVLPIAADAEDRRAD
jgi:signal transduction histidine kinase